MMLMAACLPRSSVRGWQNPCVVSSMLGGADHLRSAHGLHPLAEAFPAGFATLAPSFTQQSTQSLACMRVYAQALAADAAGQATFEQGPPAAEEALVGWRITLQCPGTGEAVQGEVLGWDSCTDHHLVLYDDGEHERLLLPQERCTLHAPQRGAASAIGPGLPAGPPSDAAAGLQSVGQPTLC